MERITSWDVDEAVWHRIAEFTNQDLTMETLVARHGSGDARLLQNYRKQASQIRVCILQAKEYFDAARASSVFTRPNHLYYGMVSLCCASMLLSGTGTKALDVLRRDKKNKHHGLDFTTGVTHTTCSNNLTLLEKTHVEVRSTGHFLNWYPTTRQWRDVYAIVTEQASDHANSQVSSQIRGREALLSSSEIIGKSYSLIDLLSILPDATLDIARNGIPVTHSRVNFEVFEQTEKNLRTLTWRIHGARTTHELEKILNKFTCRAGECQLFDAHYGNRGLSCIVTARVKRYPHPIGEPSFSFPTIRETLNEDQIIYADDEINISELVTAYLLCFALSMLSRYYPDVWIKCIESRCRAAQIIDQVLRIIMAKFPILALSEFQRIDVRISPHRPSWHK